MKLATTLALATAAAAFSPVLARADAKLSQADRQFLQESAKGNLAEVKLGTLGVSRGSTEAVREYARWMISTHSFANRELTTIVERLHGEGAPLKSMAPTDDTMGKLQNLSGPAFDRAYLEALKAGHEKATKLIDAEARDGQDEMVKSFAANLAPAVKEHLAQADLLLTAANGADAGGAAKDANMKAAAGGMSGTPKGDNGQAKAVRRQQ